MANPEHKITRGNEDKVLPRFPTVNFSMLQREDWAGNLHLEASLSYDHRVSASPKIIEQHWMGSVVVDSDGQKFQIVGLELNEAWWRRIIPFGVWAEVKYEKLEGDGFEELKALILSKTQHDQDGFWQGIVDRASSVEDLFCSTSSET